VLRPLAEPSRQPCSPKAHRWEPVEDLRGVFRCELDGVYGFARTGAFPFGRGTRPRKVTPYRCSHGGCHKLARGRVLGRGGGGSYVWTCGASGHGEALADSSAPSLVAASR
jgi:hypothetical protein